MTTGTVDKVAWTLPEVAEMTGMSLRRLQEGCTAGEIPHRKYRRRTVMTTEDIRDFLAAYRCGPTTAQQPATPDGDQADVIRIAEAKRRVARRFNWQQASQ